MYFQSYQESIEDKTSMKSEFHLKKNQRPSSVLHGSPKKTSVQQL